MARYTRHNQKEAIILGTPELQAKHTIVPKLRNMWDYHAKVIDGCELDKLLMEGKINPSAHNTLDRFAAILHRSGFLKSHSIDWANPGGQIDPSLSAAKKSQSVLKMVKIMEYLDRKAGRQARMSVVNMIILDQHSDLIHVNAVVSALDDYFSS